MKSYVLDANLQQEEDGRWSAWIAALPGCAAWGYSKEEALGALTDAAATLYRRYDRRRKRDSHRGCPDGGISGSGCKPVISAHRFEQLRNLPIRKIIGALDRDGFRYRKKKGAGRLYRHPDGRRAVIHYHHGNDTLPPGTLRSVLEATGWTEDDLKRLQLISD